jgi:hypothetical protein
MSRLSLAPKRPNDMIPAVYSVGNFKSIGAPQTIPIRPITLIFGQNSAGKSSLIQSLLLCRYALENQSFDFQVTRKWGPLVDLGGFRQYIHRHDADRDLVFEFGFHRSKLELEQSAAESESIRFLSGENADGFQNWSFCYLNGVREIALRFEVGLPKSSNLARAVEGARVKKLQLVLDGYRVVSFSLSPRGKLVLDDFSANAKPVIAGMRVLARDFVNYVRETEQEDAGLKTIVERLGLESRHKALEFSDKLPPAGRASPQPPRRWSDLRIFAAAVTERLGSVLRDFVIDGNGFALRQVPQSRLEARREEIEPRSVRAPTPRPRELECIEPSLDQTGTAEETTTIEIEAIDGPVKFFAGEMEETDELQILAKAFRFDIELALEGALSSLDRWLTYIDYIAPFRETPDRYGSLSSGRVSDATWGVAADWARLAAEPRLISEVNRLLAEKLDCPYRLAVRITAPQVDYRALQEKLERILEGRRRIGRVGEGDQTLRDIFSKMLRGKGIERLYLIDARNETEVDFCDVGFGVSQVLPVLLAAVTRDKGFVCIEQPEVHLHPKMQADLADVFILKAAVSANTEARFFLLETHSEHLILRLLRRLRESHDSEISDATRGFDLDPRNVSVNYVEIEDGEAKVTNIGVTAEGDFDKEWPQGFFDERAKELFG